MMRPAAPWSTTLLAITGLVFGMAYRGTVAAQDAQMSGTYSVVAPPVCTNDKGEAVGFVDASSGRPGVAAGMARRDESGKPVVVRSNYAAAPPVFQSFIDRLEQFRN